MVGLIAPWNFPVLDPAVEGRSGARLRKRVVLKSAQEAPRTGLHLAACFEEAGLPAGVFNVVVGRGAEVGTPLVTPSEQVRAVSFTGSVPVGRQVRDQATPLGKRVQLELGGHSPLIVMADADLGRAAEAAYAGAFWSAGQKCTATRRIYIEDEVYDAFKERAPRAHRAAGSSAIPTDPATEVGPLVSETQMDEVLGRRRTRPVGRRDRSWRR